MFFITNTQAKINLEECTFKYGSGIFLNAAGTSEWGTSGSNGGIVTLTLTNQDIVGDIVVDGYSSLTLSLVDSTITGKINTANTAAKLAITLDEDSSIVLTGNSYYTSLVNEKTDGSNLVNGTYKWTLSEEKQISTTPNSGNGQNGQPPSGSNGNPPEMPNGQPPSGSDQPNGVPPEMPNGNGQQPNGSSNQGNNGIPTGQQPTVNPSDGQIPNGNGVSNNSDEEDPENIGNYVKNGSCKLNNFAFMTLLLILATVA